MPSARVQENACTSPFPVALSPTTSSSALTANAVLMVPPRVPRSIAVTVGPAARAGPLEALTTPARTAAAARAPRIRLGVPERRMEIRMVNRGARADDVAACVDGVGAAVQAADRAEVDHAARGRPGERVHVGVAGRCGVADDLAAGTDGAGDAEGAAEGSEVDHPARARPDEGVVLTGRGEALADHLTACVH